MFPITAFFAALLAAYFVRLAFAVIRLRRGNKVALGAGGVAELEGAIRAHGNFAEYVPLGLILLALLEGNAGHPLLIAVLGCGLTIGRVLHATALSRGDLKLRVKGMKLTVTALIAAAVANLVYASWSFTTSQSLQGSPQTTPASFLKSRAALSWAASSFELDDSFVPQMQCIKCTISGQFWVPISKSST